MIAFPNCKLNLGLNIINKRADGFHNIETILFPLNWCDGLEIISQGARGLLGKKVEFDSSGIEIPTDIQFPLNKGGKGVVNLCVKAYQLLTEDYNLPPVHFFLYKNIPIGAGLGGGSADAACSLKCLNELFELQLNDQQLTNYASQLGSDCAFFINNKPVFAYQRGNRFEPIELNLNNYQFLLVYPNIPIDTGWAYQNIQPKHPKKSLKELIKLPIEKWREHIYNDFEQLVFKKYPQIAALKSQLYKSGALYASMSGSGSAVYGIFEKDKRIKTNGIFKDYVVKIV